MKLLIVTQKLDADDENLGAFYQWFERLAHACERVVILAGTIGAVPLPAGVEVYAFGNRDNSWRMSRVWKYAELFSYHYAQSDAVLFHQNPEFVLAAAPFLIAGKGRSYLWYAHGSVNWRLMIAERLVDMVLTSSAAGFRLPSKKVIYVGQAVNTELFRPEVSAGARPRALRLVTVGRVSPVKDYETIIRACHVLRETGADAWSLTIVGGPLLPRDHDYMARLKALVAEYNLGSQIHFYGSRPFSEIPSLLREHDVFLNVSRTGSLDKAVLEAMSSGITVLTANEAYRLILPPQYFLDRVSPEFIAARIRVVAREPRPNEKLRAIVMRDHSLDHTIQKIIHLLNTSI